MVSWYLRGEKMVSIGKTQPHSVRRKKLLEQAEAQLKEIQRLITEAKSLD